MQIPRDRVAFANIIIQLFPQSDLAGPTVRELVPPAGPPVTLAFIPELLEKDDLRTLVMEPLSYGIPIPYLAGLAELPVGGSGSRCPGHGGE